VRIETVADNTALREFVDLPNRLWPQNLTVPLLESTIRSWYRGTSPHPEPVRLVLVRDDAGRVVGRSTVHTDARLDDKFAMTSQLFGATDFASAEAAAALFAHLDDTARGAGRQQLLGPVSLLPNQSAGVITSGFDERGFVDSAWNPEWVPGVYEAAGFTRTQQAQTWSIQVGAVPTTPPAPAELAAAGVRLEYGDKSKMATLIPELLAVLNAAFEQLPYYTQITPAEMAAATDGLSFLLDENLLLLARDSGSGEAVAFVLVLPDISPFVQKVRGRLTPLRQLELLLTRGRYRREAILIIQGTAPARQGRGILTLLSRQLQANLARGGYRRLRTTTVGLENMGSARQFSRFGGTPLHGSTLYRRATSPTAASPASTTPSPTDPDEGIV
jgi:GNAT superfamily N-acetyltransferase